MAEGHSQSTYVLISNRDPDIRSQIERGLKKPSAEILQQLAKGLEVSAESRPPVAKIMDFLKIEEGEAITHTMINKSIENAQKKVEAEATAA